MTSHTISALLRDVTSAASVPSPWLQFGVDVVTSVATLAAVIVAICIARSEGEGRRRAEAETDRLRQRERRAEASKVTFTVHHAPGMAMATVKNDGDLPVRAVFFHIVSGEPSAPGEYVKQQFAVTIAPHDVAVERLLTDLLTRTAPHLMSFVDTHGCRWWRSETGEVTETEPDWMAPWLDAQRQGNSRPSPPPPDPED